MDRTYIITVLDKSLLNHTWLLTLWVVRLPAAFWFEEPVSETNGKRGEKYQESQYSVVFQFISGINYIRYEVLQMKEAYDTSEMRSKLTQTWRLRHSFGSVSRLSSPLLHGSSGLAVDISGCSSWYSSSTSGTAPCTRRCSGFASPVACHPSSRQQLKPFIRPGLMITN